MNIVSEYGTYFRDIYADLMERLPEFPTSDPSPNLQECVGTRPNYVNFVRAEMLARQHNLPPDIIAHLQEMAIIQHLIDYRTSIGFYKLMDEFNLNPTERSRIIRLIKKEKTYPCFSFSKNTELAINENWAGVWEKEYFPLIQQMIGKPSVLSRFITWIKRLFGSNRISQ